LYKKLKIARSTLYARFNEPNPPYDFIENITAVTGIDFFELTKTPKPYPLTTEKINKVDEPITTLHTKMEELYYKKCEEYDSLMQLHQTIVNTFITNERKVSVEIDALAQHIVACNGEHLKILSSGFQMLAESISNNPSNNPK
jgi:hypothetical protein